MQEFAYAACDQLEHRLFMEMAQTTPVPSLAPSSEA
jgi:hypothetical protein